MRWTPGCDDTLRAAAGPLVDASGSAGVVIQARTGEIVGANEEAEGLLGLTWDQMMGRTSADPRWSAVSETGLPLTGDQHPAMVTLATGQPVTGFLMGVMAPVDVGDLGRTLARTRWIDIESVPLLDADGVIGVGALFTDVSETDRGRAASDAQWAAFQLMIQNTDDVLLRTDARGTVQWASLAADRVLGWTPADLASRLFVDLVHPHDRAVVDGLQTALRQASDPDVTRAEFRMALPGGGWRWVADAASPLQDRDLRVAGEVHAIRDISAERAARDALAASEERFRLITENVSDVIVHVRDDEIVWISPSVESAFGVRPEDALGRHLDDLVLVDDRAVLDTAAEQTVGGQSAVVRLRVSADGGEYHWIDAHVRFYGGPRADEDGYIASFRIVDDLVRTEAALEHQARYDSVTGLVNRAQMLATLERLLSGDRRSGDEVALLFVDIDHFKDVNDSHGHAVGDLVLRVVGERITATLRKDDVASRFGGDEVLVVLFGLTGVEEAMRVAEKIRAAALEPIPTSRGAVQVTVSIGITILRRGEIVDRLVERADQAMYQAKRGGRNRVVAL
jgi:diguanylate cyclase (GGDEF)-like protein/PAS domain S-box-containing protein